jgi:TPR repeat protein
MKSFLQISMFIFILVVTSSMSIAGSLEDGLEAASSGNYKKAYRLWLPLAEQGDVGAQHNLGIMYFNGFGVPQDNKEAVKWFLLAARQNYAESQ